MEDRIIEFNPYRKHGVQGGRPIDTEQFFLVLQECNESLARSSEMYVRAMYESYFSAPESLVRVQYSIALTISSILASFEDLRGDDDLKILQCQHRESILNAVEEIQKYIRLLLEAGLRIGMIEPCLKLLDTLRVNIKLSLESPNPEFISVTVYTKTPVLSQKREEVLPKQEKKYISESWGLLSKLRRLMVIAPAGDTDYLALCTVAAKMYDVYYHGYEPENEPESTTKQVSEAVLAAQYKLAVLFNQWCPKKHDHLIPECEKLTYAAGRAIWALNLFSALPDSATTTDNNFLHESLRGNKRASDAFDVKRLEASLYTSLYHFKKNFGDNKELNVTYYKDCITTIYKLYDKLQRLEIDPALSK